MSINNLDFHRGKNENGDDMESINDGLIAKIIC